MSYSETTRCCLSAPTPRPAPRRTNRVPHMQVACLGAATTIVMQISDCNARTRSASGGRAQARKRARSRDILRLDAQLCRLLRASVNALLKLEVITRRACAPQQASLERRARGNNGRLAAAAAAADKLGAVMHLRNAEKLCSFASQDSPACQDAFY